MANFMADAEVFAAGAVVAAGAAGAVVAAGAAGADVAATGAVVGAAGATGAVVGAAGAVAHDVNKKTTRSILTIEIKTRFFLLSI